MHEPTTADCPVLPHNPIPATKPKTSAPADPASAFATDSSAFAQNSAAPAPAAKPRGFQLISKQQHRLIASRGGKAAHASGLAHEYTPEEALLAGRKGGVSVSRNREHMAEIGRRGARSRIRRRAEKTGAATPAAR